MGNSAACIDVTFADDELLARVVDWKVFNETMRLQRYTIFILEMVGRVEVLG